MQGVHSKWLVKGFLELMPQGVRQSMYQSPLTGLDSGSADRALPERLLRLCRTVPVGGG
jgi:hypothetical protein